MLASTCEVLNWRCCTGFKGSVITSTVLATEYRRADGVASERLGWSVSNINAPAELSKLSLPKPMLTWIDRRLDSVAPASQTLQEQQSCGSGTAVKSGVTMTT